jgi:hypothetical protein
MSRFPHRHGSSTPASAVGYPNTATASARPLPIAAGEGNQAGLPHLAHSCHCGAVTLPLLTRGYCPFSWPHTLQRFHCSNPSTNHSPQNSHQFRLARASACCRLHQRNRRSMVRTRSSPKKWRVHAHACHPHLQDSFRTSSNPPSAPNLMEGG